MGPASEHKPKKHRILVVDDHPIVRRGLRQLFDDEPDLEVVGEAEDSTDALEQLKAVEPDLVIVDLSLKRGHGLELIPQIKANHERVKMLVSSMHDESLFAERVLRAGALGYISKQESPSELINAIRQVLRGEIYLSLRMANRLLGRIVGGETLENDPIGRLSDRELQVFELIGQGLRTKQIAQELDLSPKTIEAHRENIKTKLNLKSGVEMSRHATQWVLENG